MYDNLDLFYIHERKQEEERRKRQTCCICGHTIWQEKALRLPNDGFMCDSCIEEYQEWLNDD